MKKHVFAILATLVAGIMSTTLAGCPGSNLLGGSVASPGPGTLKASISYTETAVRVRVNLAELTLPSTGSLTLSVDAPSFSGSKDYDADKLNRNPRVTIEADKPASVAADDKLTVFLVDPASKFKISAEFAMPAFGSSTSNAMPTETKYVGHVTTVGTKSAIVEYDLVGTKSVVVTTTSGTNSATGSIEIPTVTRATKSVEVPDVKVSTADITIPLPTPKPTTVPASGGSTSGSGGARFGS